MLSLFNWLAADVLFPSWALFILLFLAFVILCVCIGLLAFEWEARRDEAAVRYNEPRLQKISPNQFREMGEAERRQQPVKWTPWI